MNFISRQLDDGDNSISEVQQAATSVSTAISNHGVVTVNVARYDNDIPIKVKYDSVGNGDDEMPFKLCLGDSNTWMTIEEVKRLKFACDVAVELYD